MLTKINIVSRSDPRITFWDNWSCARIWYIVQLIGLIYLSALDNFEVIASFWLHKRTLESSFDMFENLIFASQDAIAIEILHDINFTITWFVPDIWFCGVENYLCDWNKISSAHFDSRKRRCQSLIIVSFYFQAYSCKTDSKPGTQGCSTSATWPRQLPPLSQCIFKQDFQAKMSSHPLLFQGLYPRRKAKASSKSVIVCPSFAFLAKEIANLEFQEFLHWATETGGFSYSQFFAQNRSKTFWVMIENVPSATTTTESLVWWIIRCYI